MKILLLGSGGLKIGQAGEFDYSGSQAIKALKEEGHEVVLVNPNIATVQTSENFADKVYFLPVEPYFVQKVIEKEKPPAVLLAFGGQTALNCGLHLEKKGILKKHNVKVLGTSTKAIEITEDRKLFANTLTSLKLAIPKSYAASTIKKAQEAAEKLGFPVMLRSAFSLGGQDSGVVYNKETLLELAQKALAKAPQILIEEYLAGWKEIEYEVVRDKFDNAITVCNMENFDPMGIHTGESIVVAPSQTLNNFEYHKLRQIALEVIRHLQIVGECNIQFALNPSPKGENIDYRIIEVNARLSRSSALASKATGYPLAYIAAKLALGYSLVDLKNSITKKTTAAFEPALDYVVVKIPRWDLGKFIKSQSEIGSSMQSVGEVMAIGRTFEEAIQKASRMLDIGFEGILDEKAPDLDYSKPTPWRLFCIAQSLKNKTSIAKIHKQTSINTFFLEKLKNIIDTEEKISISPLTNNLLREAKKMGISDNRIAKLTNTTAQKIEEKREKAQLRPFVKQIDTLAAEYPAKTNYLFLTYNADEDDLNFNKNESAQKVIVLGSGPYRIGSSVEFDWCCVTAAQTVQENGYSPIIVNCNPETVSTDYDMAHRLYFEELTEETVAEIIKKENPQGVIISMGGQTPNNLAVPLSKRKVNILGTSPQSIDQAEDRSKFSALCDELKIAQPVWAKLMKIKDAAKFAQKIGYPVLVRPSYVLSGAAMNVAFNSKDLTDYLKLAASVSTKYPVVISKFHQNAKEIEIDAVAANGKLVCFAISEHIENAGVHSGDSTIVLPPQKLYLKTVKTIEAISQKIALKLKISGPFNIQFLAYNNNVLVIECNLRASRSLPFVSKVSGTNFAKVATRVILGKKQEKIEMKNLPYVGVKSPQFSFARIKGADPVLRVEMASTGEVAAFGDDFYEAFLKSIIASGSNLPSKSVFISLAGDENKANFLDSAKELSKLFTIYATKGTSDYLKKHQIDNKMLYKIHDKKSPNILSFLNDKKIDLVINIFDPYFENEFDDEYLIRRATIDFGIPILTNLQTAELFAKAISIKKVEDLKILPWNFYLNQVK